MKENPEYNELEQEEREELYSSILLEEEIEKLMWLKDSEVDEDHKPDIGLRWKELFSNNYIKSVHNIVLDKHGINVERLYCDLDGYLTYVNTINGVTLHEIKTTFKSVLHSPGERINTRFNVI